MALSEMGTKAFLAAPGKCPLGICPPRKCPLDASPSQRGVAVVLVGKLLAPSPTGITGRPAVCGPCTRGAPPDGEWWPAGRNKPWRSKPRCVAEAPPPPKRHQRPQPSEVASDGIATGWLVDRVVELRRASPDKAKGRGCVTGLIRVHTTNDRRPILHAAVPMSLEV